MKKILLFIVIWCMWGTRIYSQDVFPKSDAIWNIKLPTFSSPRYVALFGLLGDTLINDTVYQKLYLLNDTLLRPESIEYYMGAIRQENQQVWFRVDSIRSPVGSCFSGEFLLYDFSLQKGDGFTYGNKIFLDSYSTFPLIIYKNYWSSAEAFIERVTIDKEGRKHLFVNYWSSSFQDEWIEGIGSIHGLFWQLFYPPMPYMEEQYRSQLICFKYKEDRKNFNSPCQECFCPASYNATIYEEVKGNVFLRTNLERKEILIRTLEESLPCRIELYNVSGTLVMSQEIIKPVTFFSYELLNGGIYIYRISRYGKAMQRGKIMIN